MRQIGGQDMPLLTREARHDLSRRRDEDGVPGGPSGRRFTVRVFDVAKTRPIVGELSS